MAIPAYDQFYRAILEALSDGLIHNSKETISYCADVYHLSDEDRVEMLQSGRQTVLANRVGWARTYLKKAGLISSPSRGKYQITVIGKKALDDPNKTIDNEYLSHFKGFQEFVKSTQYEKNGTEQTTAEVESVQTPMEIMDSAYSSLIGQLADELMTNIMDQDPSFFERLVVDLLGKMGYGCELEKSGEVTGKTGDEGIDGIIREDTLGFDKIYVQAKRWAGTHTVGEPDIQQFAGALMGKGANKGLFITTSHFSNQAISYVERHMAAKIVLIDGDMLTKLMIKYGLGVSTVHTYEIKRVDTDYFNEDSE